MVGKDDASTVDGDGNGSSLSSTWGCFIAVQHINPGDMITANYLGYDEFR